jgi:UDP-N-acetylglucosamine kinase
MAALHKQEPDVFARVYETILDTYARNKTSLKFPRLAVIGGQPGAGKSTVTGVITESLNTTAEPVIINFDDIRNFHPAAEEIFKHHPFEMAVYTNEDTWVWTEQVLNHTRQAKNNALYETTLRVASPIQMIIQSFQDEGYSVDMHALAVNSKLSIQGIYERFENQLHFMKAPRWTGIDFHDACYVAFPANVEQLETSARLERISVYRRNGVILYQNTDTANQPTGAQQAIIDERNMGWTVETKKEYLDKWAEIVAAIESRDEVKPDWYVENARRLFQEAELLSASRQPKAGEHFDMAQIEAVTHHHVFVAARNADELICFDKSVIAAPSIPGRNLQLVAQQQDAQP